MREVLFALSNLLHYIAGPEDAHARDMRIQELVEAAQKAPGPRVKRLAELLALLAIDAAP